MYVYRERDYKELFHVIMVTGKSKSTVCDRRLTTQGKLMFQFKGHKAGRTKAAGGVLRQSALEFPLVQGEKSAFCSIQACN